MKSRINRYLTVGYFHAIGDNLEGMVMATKKIKNKRIKILHSKLKDTLDFVRNMNADEFEILNETEEK